MTSSPEPLGRWSSSCGTSLPFPQLGMRYRVIQEFKDHDTDVHPAGEEWTFLGSNFVPYHSGLSFVVSFDDQQECLLPLLWMPEGQGHVLDNLEQYIAPLEDGQRLQYHPQLPTKAAVVEKPADPEVSLTSVALPWLLVLSTPFVLTSAYLWLAHRFGSWDRSADLNAVIVCVLAGAVVLWRVVRPHVLWLVLYLPIVGVAVFIWAWRFDCFLAGNCK